MSCLPNDRARNNSGKRTRLACWFRRLAETIFSGERRQPALPGIIARRFMELITDFFERTAKVLTVAELTRAIRGTLETRFGAVWVQGEISNYKQHPSGHQYFTLKDSRAQIACVIFRNAPLSIRQPLADGAQVQVYGKVSVFETRGQYQLSVEIVQPRGLGLLQAKFETLKRKLETEGLFDPARKKTRNRSRHGTRRRPSNFRRRRPTLRLWPLCKPA